MNDVLLSNPAAFAHLLNIGEAIRQRRKALKISAVSAAESAAISRITWHRIEKGDAGVSAGSYATALSVLGLAIGINYQQKDERPSSHQNIPTHITLDNYPELRRISWHVADRAQLTPREAFEIYDRNQRHFDEKNMTDKELRLLKMLKIAFANDESQIHK